MFGNTCLQIKFFAFLGQPTRISNISTCKNSHLKVRNWYDDIRSTLFFIFRKGHHLQKSLTSQTTAPYSSICQPSGRWLTVHFISVEQRILMECRSASKALYCLLAVHYVFDISYNQNVKDIYFSSRKRLLESLILDSRPQYTQISVMRLNATWMIVLKQLWHFTIELEHVCTVVLSLMYTVTSVQK